MNEREAGFTLIEMAIVLVIVGLLVGGVLAGQELIRNARVRNLISQQDGAKAAYFGFQDRFRGLPGDYNGASANIKCTPNPCIDGNGNGRIEPGGAGAIREDILAWNHLTAAGFINGSYTMADSGVTAVAPSNTPGNPYGAYMQIAYDGLWGKSSNELGPGKVSKHSLKTGNQIPVEIIAEVDRKIDDGRPYSGAFQFSTYSATDSTRPDYAGTNDNSCTSAEDPTTNWNERFGQSNCGGASLL